LLALRRDGHFCKKREARFQRRVGSLTPPWPTLLIISLERSLLVIEIVNGTDDSRIKHREIFVRFGRAISLSVVAAQIESGSELEDYAILHADEEWVRVADLIYDYQENA
jgi:hypothetical protein